MTFLKGLLSGQLHTHIIVFIKCGKSMHHLLWDSVTKHVQVYIVSWVLCQDMRSIIIMGVEVFCYIQLGS